MGVSFPLTKRIGKISLVAGLSGFLLACIVGWANAASNRPDYTSYLISYSVNISQLTWDTWFDLPRPVMGEPIIHTFLPLALR